MDLQRHQVPTCSIACSSPAGSALKWEAAGFCCCKSRCAREEVFVSLLPAFAGPAASPSGCTSLLHARAIQTCLFFFFWLFVCFSSIGRTGWTWGGTRKHTAAPCMHVPWGVGKGGFHAATERTGRASMLQGRLAQAMHRACPARDTCKASCPDLIPKLSLFLSSGLRDQVPEPPQIRACVHSGWELVGARVQGGWRFSPLLPHISSSRNLAFQQHLI